MRWQRTFTKMLVFAVAPICIGLIMLGIVQSKSNGITQWMNIQGEQRDIASRTVMRDPQGDADLAGLIHPSAAHSTTVQIILSRKVLGYQLPCLGFQGMGNLESRPADTFGLVVFGGELYPTWPISQAAVPPMPYIAYLYDFRYGATTAGGTAYWPSLRAVFGGPGWPEYCPMYVSPDGQPSLAELELGHLTPAKWHTWPQDLHVSQVADGWKVTVVRVYAEGNVISFDYTVTGPHSRYKVDPPVLSIEGKELPSSRPTGLDNEVLGPAVGSLSSRSLGETAQPRHITVHFVVPAIHVRPPIYPCEEPGTPPAENPPPTTSTPAPDVTALGRKVVTPVPDVKTVGPFIFDLKVIVQPKPTERPVPSPVPTSTGVRIPLPQSTGQP